MSTWIYEQSDHTPEWGPSGVPVAVMGILQRRGIRTREEAEDFLSAAPRCTYDPALLPDLPAAADALLQAAKDGRTICIYGDYDADGVTSTALL